MKRKADDNSCETARKRNRHRSFKEVMELIESQDGLLDIVQKLDVDDSQSWNIVSATMKLSKSELVGLKTHFNPKPSSCLETLEEQKEDTQKDLMAASASTQLLFRTGCRVSETEKRWATLLPNKLGAIRSKGYQHLAIRILSECRQNQRGRMHTMRKMNQLFVKESQRSDSRTRLVEKWIKGYMQAEVQEDSPRKQKVIFTATNEVFEVPRWKKRASQLTLPRTAT